MTPPYYQKDGITLYCADMRDVDLPPADLVLTDPPYAEQTHAGARREARVNEGRWRTGGNEPQKLVGFASAEIAELRAMFERFSPQARRWVISFMDWRHIYHFEQQPPAGLRFVRFGVWIKPNGAPQFTGDRPATGWEGIAFMHRADGKMRWNGGGHHGVYTYPIAHKSDRIADNPTAKPFPLVADLIREFSEKGDLVIDPFCGNGTTLAIAKLLGRQAIGVEQDEALCAALVRWLEHPIAKRKAVGGVRKRTAINPQLAMVLETETEGT